MQSSYIKQEPNHLDGLENKQNSSNDILTAISNVAFKIKSEPIDDGFSVPKSITDNLYRCIGIIKEEVDISDDNESDEQIIHDDNLEKNQEYNYCKNESTKRGTNVKWHSNDKSTSKELRPIITSGNNVILYKDLRISLERISKSEISRYKRADYPENIDQNDVYNKWSSNCKLHCSRCNKTIDATSTFKTTKCQTCKIAMSLQCKKCERSYDKPNTMYNHLMNRCYPRKKYNCAHCSFETTIRKTIERHMQRIHNENDQPTECLKCHKTFKHLYALRQHQKFCKTERFSCTICPYKSHFSTNFKNHMASHERFNKLSQESLSNINDKSMINDINSEFTTVLEKWKILINFERFCPQCNTTFENNMFNNSRSANLMYECHLCKTKLLMQCLKCNIRLKNVQKMREHLLTKCALKINYKCPECDYETAYKCNLKDHVKRCHTIIDPKELKTCPKCNKSFRIIRDFNVHQKSCGMKRYDYHCDHCVFRTKRKRNMKIHTQIHMNTGSVKVKNNSNDKYSIKAYCSTCKALRKAGPQSTMLCFVCKNLMMFKCRNCDEKALTKKDIRLHESKKHGCVYHECPNCDKAFLRLSILTKHKKICKIAAAQKK